MSVPEEIKQYRPGPSTVVKNIHGHYYVYPYEATKLASGKWGTKTGKCIGSIVPGKGFIANRNFELYRNRLPDTAVREAGYDVLEYGQYALVEAVSAGIYESLRRWFPLSCADRIFICAVILCANGFTLTDQLQECFAQSWLSREYPDISFGTGRDEMASLLEEIGREMSRIAGYENDAIRGAKSIALVKRAVCPVSEEHGPGDTNRDSPHPPVHFLMGYDPDCGMPLFSRTLRGGESTLEELMAQGNFQDILLVVDRELTSEKNLSLLSSSGNRYIIPIPSPAGHDKSAVRHPRFDGDFHVQSGESRVRVEYSSIKISDTEQVYVFRETGENERNPQNRGENALSGSRGFPSERDGQWTEMSGVSVLQSNAPLPPDEIFRRYQNRLEPEIPRRFGIPGAELDDWMAQRPDCAQGLAFLMLVTGQMDYRLRSAVGLLHDDTLSVDDILLMARALKMVRCGSEWKCRNRRKPELEVLSKLGFAPVSAVPDTQS